MTRSVVGQLESLVDVQLYELTGKVRSERLDGPDLARLTYVLCELSEYARELAAAALRELDKVYPNRPGQDALSEMRLQLTQRALEVSAALAGDAVEAVEKLARHARPVTRTDGV